MEKITEKQLQNGIKRILGLIKTIKPSRGLFTQHIAL